MSIVGDQVDALYNVAQDGDYEVIDRLAQDAGLRWVCPIRPWTNMPGEPCGDCGRSEAEARALLAEHDGLVRVIEEGNHTPEQLHRYAEIREAMA